MVAEEIGHGHEIILCKIGRGIELRKFAKIVVWLRKLAKELNQEFNIGVKTGRKIYRKKLIAALVIKKQWWVGEWM